MRPISRREFLRRTALGLGAVSMAELLAACAPIIKGTPLSNSVTASPVPNKVSPASTSPVVPTTANAPTSTSQTNTTPSSIADLAVAHGGEDPEQLVRRAIAALGGMEKFVPKGANVIVKPNMCIPAPFTQGATTNPIVVATVVKMALEAGAKKVMVLDYPFVSTSSHVYDACGIGSAVTAVGGVMEPIADYKWVNTPIPNGVAMKNIKIYSEVLKADVLINVPVAKNHNEALFTLALKNLMGIVAQRPEMHISLPQSIVDVNTRIKSNLTVIDCVRIMMKGGPTGGPLDNLKKLDTVIASADILAADSYALSFFDTTPDKVPYISLGQKAGLGRSDIKNLKIEDIAVG